MSTFYKGLDPCHNTGVIYDPYAQCMVPDYQARIGVYFSHDAVGYGSECASVAEDLELGLALMLPVNHFRADCEVADLAVAVLFVEKAARAMLPPWPSWVRDVEGAYRGQHRRRQRRRVPPRPWRRLPMVGTAGTEPNPAIPTRALGGRDAD